MFSPGDTVVYRHHVCEIAAVREAYFEDKDYLELHALFENSLKLFVALDDAHEPTLRPVMTRKKALDLVDSQSMNNLSYPSETHYTSEALIQAAEKALNKAKK